MTDPQFNAKDLREQRLPIVSDCRLRFRMSFAKIAKEIEVKCGQQVNASTVKRDWEYLVKSWRKEAAANTKDACDEELMTCDAMIAELSRLYELSKQPKKKKRARVRSAMTDIDAFGNPVISKPLDKPVPTETEQSNQTEEQIGDVRILAELRKWCERRDRLLGLDKVQVDITSAGKEFKGFSSVLPVVPDIVEIVRRIDEERAERENE